MNPVNAFVGHSFVADDLEVVRIFLDYFDVLAKSLPAFGWEHAEEAEPRSLAEKVRRIIADKNTFIGICTRRERVIADDALSGLILKPSHSKAKTAAFEWKTSDWVIQEIGMAVAKGMNIILLRENGVRDPGGLQGDLEYIPFDRSNPQASFPKLMQMISTLSPRDASVSMAATERTTADKAVAEATPSVFDNPTPDWNRDRYEMSMFRMIFTDDQPGIKRIDEAYRQTPESSENDNLITWEAYVEETKILKGKDGTLGRLEALAAENPHNDKIIQSLARAYGTFGNHRLAAQTFVVASEQVSDPTRKARLWQFAAEQFAADGDFNVADTFVDKIRDSVPATAANEFTMLQAILNICVSKKDEDAAIAVMERIVELKPDDFSIRFDLAFKQSEHGNNDLALHHYLKIPHDSRNAITWNNLGVSFDGFKLVGKAISAYRRAESKDETLAMSNLGYKFLGVGFLREAQDECDKALAIPNRHKNVGQLLARLMELPEMEEKRQSELLNEFRPKAEFYKTLGRAVSLRETTSLGEQWQGPDCVLKVGRTSNELQLVGTYEVDQGGLAAILSGVNAAPKLKYEVRYSCKIRGAAFFGTVKRDRDGASPLETAAGHKKVLMTLNSAGDELSVSEGANTLLPSYYLIKRIA